MLRFVNFFDTYGTYLGKDWVGQAFEYFACMRYFKTDIIRDIF